MQISNQFKNAISLVSGTGIAQLIPLLFSPILTRLYSPVEFGILAFFVSASTLLGIFSSGQYEISIIKPKKLSEAFILMVSSNFISFFFSIVLLVFILFFGEYFLLLTDVDLSRNQLYLLPLGVFFVFQYQCLSYWLTRIKKFKILSIIKVVQSATLVSFSLAFGFFFTEGGLIYAIVISYGICSVYLLYQIYRLKEQFSLARVKQLLLSYAEYPKFVMTSSAINTAASQTPIYFITKSFSSNILGLFSFANRILVAPVGIVSLSIGQIYYKEISEKSNHDYSQVRPYFIKVLVLLTVLSIICFLPFVFFGEWIFSFLFGEEWELAGSYAQIMSFSLIIKFIVSPVSTTLLALSRIKFLSIWQISYLCSCLLVIFLSLQMDVESYIHMYVINDVIMYSIYLMLIFFSVKQFELENAG